MRIAHPLRATLVTAITASASALVGTARADEPIVPLRDGIEFQFALGWGAGPTSNGIFHNMEIGGAITDDGWALCYEHAFIWSKDVAKPKGGSDLWGGHFAMLKIPVLDDVVYKVAAGFGENVDQSDGFEPRFGVGWTMGVDFDLPAWETSGFTITALVLNAWTPDVGFQWGIGSAIAWTLF
jgi:hypothetical protein